MVGQAESSGSEFGIVLAKGGGIVNVGCTVVVENVVNRYPDGRFDVLTRGKRRFLIESVNNELDWLRGDVTFFDDDDIAPVPNQLRQSVMNSFGFGPETAVADSERLSFLVAGMLDDLDFKNTLQVSRSETERLRLLAVFLETWLPRQAYEAKMKRAVPTNGHGHKPAGI